jgi:hypothetical protein
VILLDSDIILIDIRYPNDPKFPVNRQVLGQLHADGTVVGMTVQALLEIVGILSFNVASHQVSALPTQICAVYQLSVVPDLHQHPQYAGCTVIELINQMKTQMALGDAVQAVQVARFAAFAECLLTWNAKHFQGKTIVPVMTPADWLNQKLAAP